MTRKRTASAGLQDLTPPVSNPPPACPVCKFLHTTPFMRIDARDYWRCDACNATFLDPSQLPARSVELAEYRLHSNDVNDAGYRKFLLRLAAPLLARLPPGLSGLDYGCGPGLALAAMLAEAAHRMALYDPLFHDDPAALTASYDFTTPSRRSPAWTVCRNPAARWR